MAEIGSLELNITTTSGQAAGKIQQLAAAIKGLKNASTGLNLSAVASQISGIASSVNHLDTSKITKMNDAISKMQSGNIDIGISNNGDFSDVVSEVADLGEVSITASDGMEKLSDTTADLGNEMSKTTSEVKQTSEAVKETGNAAKESTSKFGKLLNSIKRIAMYRLIRSAMKMISQGVAEGVKNLNAYSQAINSTDAAAAHSTLSQYASTFLYMKNAVGAAVAPLVQSLLPVIQTVAGWFVTAANAINQFMSALQGKSTFTRAKEYAVEYGDALGGAAGSAKELQKTLLGFDEINKLNGVNGGGGGGGGNALNTSEMFEEVAIDSLLKDFGTAFKLTVDDVLFDWDDLNGEQIAEKIIAGIGGVIGGIAGFALGGVGGAVLGILIGTGVGMVLDTFIFDHDGKVSKSEIWKIVKSGLITATGGVIGGLVAGPAGVFAGLAIGLTVSTVIQGIKWAKEQKAINAFYDTEYGAQVKNMKDDIEQHLTEALDLQARINSITVDIPEEKIVNLEAAKRLIDEIFYLDEKPNKTTLELETLKTKIELLNGLGLDGIHIQFDELTNKVDGSKKALEEQIDALQREYKMEALKEGIIAQYKAQAEAEIGLKNAQLDVNAAQKEYNSLVASADAKQRAYNAKVTEMTRKLDLYTQGTQDWTWATAEQQEELERLGDEIGNMGVELDKTKVAINQAKSALDSANTSLEVQRANLSAATKQTQLWEQELAKLNGKYTAKVAFEVTGLNDLDKAIAKAERLGLRSGTSGTGVRVNTGPTSGFTYETKASGGYVNSGNLFIAQESGPELVGRIGNQTAVANTDQMVEALSKGVYNGVTSAMGNGGGNQNITVLLDGEVVYKNVVKRNNRAVQSTGRSPLLV